MKYLRATMRLHTKHALIVAEYFEAEKYMSYETTRLSQIYPRATIFWSQNSMGLQFIGIYR